jgi:hypothetical protein
MNHTNASNALYKKIILFFALTLCGWQHIQAELYLDSYGCLALPESAAHNRSFTQSKKKVTVLVYVAADNDLYPFAYRNIAQMKQVGSNDNLNILVHLDIRHSGQPKVTKRIYIEQDKVWQIGPDYVLDSGSDVTLFDSVNWALQDFPSDHFILDLWNHGSGDLNPILKKTINPSQLFHYNAETGLIELDRSIGFIDFVDQLNREESEEELSRTNASCKRGICFDETNGTYLDDAKLMRAFTKIVKERNGKKIDIILFDACLMAGTGTAQIMSQFADYMVASEEVVPGSGYNYQLLLQPLLAGHISMEDFAKHVVASFYATYGKQTNDYTQSALKLANFKAVSNNINLLSILLIDAIHQQKRNSVKQVIKKCRSRQTCTYFDEPTYIDLYNFYDNLLKNIDQIALNTIQETTEMIAAIKHTLQDGLKLIHNLVVSNIAGKNLAGAHGLSIYFPEYNMTSPSYQSYNSTEFAKNNSWPKFLQAYLA